MREGSDKNIEFVVNIKNKNQHLWPSHLSAVYISDRIEDIKKGRNTEDVNVVITVQLLNSYDFQVPRYFNEGQIVDFMSGLEVKEITNFLLIYETDAIALNYGYFPNLRNEFCNNNVYILFVGVGFIESQAFVIRYSEVGRKRID